MLSGHYPLRRTSIDPSRDPTKRRYVDSDLQSVIDLAFKNCDKDRNGYIQPQQFPIVMLQLAQIIGAEIPSHQESLDLFDQLDVNGDGKLTREEVRTLFAKFFQILKEQDIVIYISKQSNILRD